MAPEYCPNCGAPVPPSARSCPECGSDETTGWAEDAYASRLNLPDQEFDYEEFTQREFGQERSPKPQGQKWLWWVVAVLILLAILFTWLR